MPLQNRVNPFGQIFATSAKGAFMGNRGILHDAERQLSGRPWRHKNWVICSLAFGGRKREIMAPGRYTELFFLDEATALSAGHRPCAECRRQAYVEYRQCFAAARPDLGPKLASTLIDATLHAERVNHQAEKQTWQTLAGELPTGAMFLQDSEAWLMHSGRGLRWSTSGYDAARRLRPDERVEVLTPRSTTLAIARGYEPDLHPTAREV